LVAARYSSILYRGSYEIYGGDFMTPRTLFAVVALVLFMLVGADVVAIDLAWPLASLAAAHVEWTAFFRPRGTNDRV